MTRFITKKAALAVVIALIAVTVGCYKDDSASRDSTSLLAAVANEQESGRPGGSSEEETLPVPRLASSDAGVALPQSKKNWTVLVYLDGDNNLSKFSEDDVAEMMKIGSGPNLNVVLLWDNDPSQGGGKSKHGYYYVTNEGAVLLKDIGEVNMGDPRTATDFIDFAVQNFPADKYFWIWWNHGGAVDRAVMKGVAWDDSSGDHMSETEQRGVMQHFKSLIRKKVDIVGFDACLMATAEIAVQYADLASYLAASEQTEPGSGWDYSFLSLIRDKPTSSARSVAYAVLKYYKTFYRSEEDVTFSVMYLAHAPRLSAAIHEFAAAAMASGAPRSAFRLPAKGLPMFGEYFDGDRTRYFTKDLRAYLEAVAAAPDVPEAVKERARACIAVISDKKLIPYEWHGSAWNGAASGMSITLKRATRVYRDLEICRATQWDEFLNWAEFPANDYKY